MKKLLIIALASLASLLLASCVTGGFKGTISVRGDASVFAVPDSASLSVGVEERAPTTREAQELANRKLQEVLAALNGAGVEDRKIQTSRINFRQEQHWDESLRAYRVTGQIVSQSLAVKFEDLGTNPRILGATLDVLGSIDGIQIGNLSFAIKDTTEQYIEARRLAFAKAEQKAGELAGYAGLRLGKAVSITEQLGSMPVPLMQTNLARSYDAAPAAASELPGGEIEIGFTVDVVFATR